MSYTVVELAKEKLPEYGEVYEDLKKRVSLSLFSLPRTKLNSGQKKKHLQELLQNVNSFIRETEEILSKLNNVSFAENEIDLWKQKEDLKIKYEKLISLIKKIKETIWRQAKKDEALVIPWQQKVPKIGYCYSCDIDITGSFPYELRKEEQEIMGVEVVEGSEFCSQACLLNYCDEYKERETRYQQEEIKTKEKIENCRKLVSKHMEEKTGLTEKINKLRKREKELEFSLSDIQFDEPKPGFFRRLGQKLGITKEKVSPQSRLEEVRKRKAKIRTELGKVDQNLKKALIALSVNEQLEEKRKKVKQISQQQKGKIPTLEVEKEEEEE